jgi:hypothetical protein
MIEINIITTDIESAEHIRSTLENEALAIHGFIEKEASVKSPCKWKITALTKAIFFDKILARVLELAPATIVTVYSKPIVNMQWEQADLLLKTSKTALV